MAEKKKKKKKAVVDEYFEEIDSEPIDLDYATILRNDFEEELSNLTDLYNEICDLDDETYEHFTQIKNSHGKGTLSFVHLQTSNIISLKTAKMKIITDRTNIKKSMYDLLNKAKAAASEGSTGSVQEQMLALYDIIKKDTTAEPVTSTDEDVYMNTHDVKTKKKNSSSLDKRIKDILAETPEFFTDNEQNLKYLNNTVLKVKRYKSKKTHEETWKFVAVDFDNNIVKDYVLPKKANYDMHFEKIDSVIKAIDQNDTIYELFE